MYQLNIELNIQGSPKSSYAIFYIYYTAILVLH